MNWIARLKDLETPTPGTDKTDRSPLKTDLNSFVSNVSRGVGHIQIENYDERLETLLAAACRGVSFPDGSPFTVQWFRAQLDDADIVGILEDDGPVSMLAAYARSFASHPWDLRAPFKELETPPPGPDRTDRSPSVSIVGKGVGQHPNSSLQPEPQNVRCGDCQHFTPDLINPEAGIGNCAIAGEGSRDLLYPFKYHECGDFAERRV